MLRHVVQDELLHLLDGHGLAFLEDDAGHDLLAHRLVRYADHLHVAHLRMGVDEFLDFLRVDILTAADDHILQTAGNTVITLRRPAGKVARVQPAVLVDGGGGCLGHLIVTLHNIVTAGHKLSDHAVRAVLSGFRIHNLALDLRKCASDGGNSHFQRIGRTAHGAAGRSLGLAVDDYDLGHVHLVHHVTHDGDRAGASRHDAGPHMAEIRLREIRMRKHGDEHGRYAVEGGDMLIVDAGKRRFRREIRNRQDRAAVGHGGRHGKDHAEAVEHGHLDHHPVFRGQIHAVPDALAVVDDIVMGQHDALGETCRSGSILHVADVIDIDRGRHPADFLHGRAGRVLQRLLPGQGSVHAEADRNHIAQEGQTPAMQRGTGFISLDLRAEFIHNLPVVRIAVSLNHNQGMRVRLAQQIFRLMDLVGGVHGHKHRADLGRRPEGQEPLGNIGRPDRHLGSGFHAQGNQGAGKFIHVVPELAVGPGIIQRRELDRKLVRELFHHRVEHLREGLVDQVAVFPDIAALAALAPV